MGVMEIERRPHWDDAQIAVWSGAKEYGSTPGVRITLSPIVETGGGPA